MAELAPDVLVERMVTGAVAELIIGLTSDPQFGTALVVGAGGILTELLKDSVTLILPTTRTEIERALRTLKVWKLVEGFRGKSGDQRGRDPRRRGGGRASPRPIAGSSRNSTSTPCSF